MIHNKHVAAEIYKLFNYMFDTYEDLEDLIDEFGKCLNICLNQYYGRRDYEKIILPILKESLHSHY